MSLPSPPPTTPDTDVSTPRTPPFADSATLTRLHWQELVDRLASLAATSFGEDAWHQSAFLGMAATPDACQKEIVTHQLRVMVLKHLYQEAGDPPIAALLALPKQDRPLWRLRMTLEKHGTLNVQQACLLLTLLKTLNGWVGWVKNNWYPVARRLGERYPDAIRAEQRMPWSEAFQCLDLLPPLYPLIQPLDRFLDPDTVAFRPDASPALQALSEKLQQERLEARRLLDHLATQWPSGDGPTGPTERLGRLVLPIRSSFYKADMGVIVGRSDTGQTLYVEPTALVKKNNRLQQLEADLEEESERLLRLLHEKLAPHLELLPTWWDALTLLDRLHAATLLSLSLNAAPVRSLPPDTPGPLILAQARHPLLLLEGTRQVKPNTLKLGEAESRGLLISGPNAGGKTISLKTLGLCVLMHHAGLPLPVDEGSQLPWIPHLRTYLGDAQDEHAGLSSFSAYLTWLRELPLGTDKPAWLILMDEIAAATDPTEGGALAQAILDRLIQEQALVVATTHLEALKRFALAHPQMANAAMVFNPETMEPTYRLALGTPGASHTLQIARKHALPAPLIDQAQGYLAQHSVWTEELIAKLERQTLALEHDRQVVSDLKKELSGKEIELSLALKRLEDDKKQLLREWRTQMRDRFEHVENALKRLEKAVRTAERTPPQPIVAQQGKPQKAAPEPETAPPPPLTLSADDLLFNRLTALQEKFRRLEAQGRRSLDDLEAFLTQEAGVDLLTEGLFELKKGETVHCVSLKLNGTLVKVDSNGIATLQSGLMRLQAPVTDLRPAHWQDVGTARRLIQQALSIKTGLVEKRLAQKHQEKQTHHQAMASQTAASTATGGSDGLSATCDLRGMRALEALEVLDTSLDRQYPTGTRCVRIIHGLGTGALKRAVREHLKDHPLVEHWTPAAAVEGGDGVTLAYFEADPPTDT